MGAVSEPGPPTRMVRLVHALTIAGREMWASRAGALGAIACSEEAALKRSPLRVDDGVVRRGNRVGAPAGAIG
jgi:hypothetical protein